MKKVLESDFSSISNGINYKNARYTQIRITLKILQ